MVAVLLFKPGSEVYDTIESLRTAAEARAFLSDAMPPLVPYLRDADLERFVQRPVSRLPHSAGRGRHPPRHGRTDGRTDRPTDGLRRRRRRWWWWWCCWGMRSRR